VKYITTELPDGKQQIFVFDDDIMHSDFFEAIKGMAKTTPRAWEYNHIDSKVVGAGFVHKGVCQGRSESLGIASRGLADTALLGMV
jgi:hypothetical protein